MKDNIILGIGIIIGVFFLLSANSQKSDEFSIINIHYYDKFGNEIDPISEGDSWILSLLKGQSFSTVSLPGQVGVEVDQISFDISGTATGNSFSNIKVAYASPTVFKNALPTTSTSLAEGESKILFSSSLIDVEQFESYSQPVPFSISVSAYDDYKKQTVYSPSRIDLEISNLCPIGVDNGDGTCTVVLQSIGDAGVWGADFGTWSDDNFGSGFQFWTLDDSQVLYSGRMRSYLKFDVSSLQGLENDITDAGITLTVYQNFGGGRLDLDVGVYQVYDDSWTEGTITFNNQPCGNNRNIDNSVNCNLNVIDVDHSRGSFINGGDKFMSWNVLPTVINEVGLRDQEISFVFVDLLGDARTNFFSKETTYSIYRPKLTVTYTK